MNGYKFRPLVTIKEDLSGDNSRRIMLVHGIVDRIPEREHISFVVHMNFLSYLPIDKTTNLGVNPLLDT